MMLARELIKSIARERIPARFNRPVRGLTYEASSVLPGMAYFALRRRPDDGHDHVVEAVDRGAGWIVSERFGQISPRVVNVRVRDTRVALARAAAQFHGWPSRELRVVALTGGEHLPGVAFFVRQFLALAGRSTGLIGTIEHHLGRHVLPSQAGCEEALDIQRMLASLVREKIETGVVELNERAIAHGWARDLEIETLVELCWRDERDEAAAGTALRARHRLIVKVDTENGFGVEAQDGEGGHLCRVRVGSCQAGLEGWRCQMETPCGRRTFRLPLAGGDQLKTVVVAAVVAVALGVPAERLPVLCRRLDGVPGEREFVRRGQPFGVIVDGAADPGQLAELLREVRGVAPGRLLLLAGARGDQPRDVPAQLGALAARAAGFTLVTANDPGREPLSRLNQEFLQSAVSVRPGAAEIEPDRARAIDRLIGLAAPGDLVLLTGKGRRATQEIERTIAPFDDRRHAARALEALGWCRHQQGRSVGCH
jgi:UDP-N-acetylmuramoyl-L-alanyl-D-glutamate--2,6-diaminopimelate ligase